MRLPVILALAASLAGCASSSQVASRELFVGLGAQRPAARAEIPAAEAGAFLQRAVAVLQDEGLRIAARSATQIVTAPRELDLRFGVRAARVRELTMVHVSGATVRVEIVRAVRDPASARWLLSLDPDLTEETTTREARLLRAMLPGPRSRVEVSLR
ncbi:MAG TPA: hypothetical protein VLT47_13875 [Anaeromyxobacteraceae bacterium]|nr:hypothetical protein [Anaeromyxobacteraceae bacterium]